MMYRLTTELRRATTCAFVLLSLILGGCGSTSEPAADIATSLDVADVQLVDGLGEPPLDGGATDLSTDGSIHGKDGSGSLADAKDGSVADGIVDAANEVDLDLIMDVEPLDGTIDDVTSDYAAEEVDCGEGASFDYSCIATEPDTCPEGVCFFGLCIAPKLDPHRWDDCGDGHCDVCETAEGCPADCGEVPVVTGQKIYDDPKTLTLFVHGFEKRTDEQLETLEYGSDMPCSDFMLNLQALGVDHPCGDTPETETDPAQLASIEYYGLVPAPWLDADDIAEIEAWPMDGPGTGLQRYATVTAKWIRHKLDISGANYVNLACSSMGCLISRYIMENDVEGLASEGRIVKWFTMVGVIAGARLARAFDNPTIQTAVELLGINANDFVHLNPDYVQDYACAWDHSLYEGNSPLWAGTLIHHVAGTDPRIKSALNIKLLELKNPNDEPNDGIMFTFDEYFHLQSPEASFVTASGEPMMATHSLLYYDHNTVRGTDGAAILGLAAFFHKRKVVLRLETLELTEDLEKYETFDGHHGVPPADVVVELAVKYDPYVSETFGLDAMIHETTMKHRAAPMVTLAAGHEATFHLELFAAPILDGMDAMTIDLDLVETDWYPRVGLSEWSLDKTEDMLHFDGVIPLEDHTFTVENDIAKAVLSVEVIDLY